MRKDDERLALIGKGAPDPDLIGEGLVWLG